MEGREREEKWEERKASGGTGGGGGGRGSADDVHVKCGREACGAALKWRVQPSHHPISDPDSVSAPRPYARCLNVRLGTNDMHDPSL